MNPVKAITDRDPEALMAAFSNVNEAEAFKLEILPQMSAADCKWFWQQVMTAEQLEATLGQVRDVCQSICRKTRLTIGKDYTGGVDAFGDPVLIIDRSLHDVFYKALSAERHSFLRFYLQEPIN